MNSNNQNNKRPTILEILRDQSTSTILTIITILITLIGAPTIYSLIRSHQNNTPVKAAISSLTPSPSPAPIPSPDITQNNLIQLNSSYRGTAYSTDLANYANGSITFTLLLEDQQGNVNMETTFQQLGTSSKTDNYSCQGTAKNKQLILYCKSDTDPSYVLNVQGIIYADNHMEGTERATHLSDNSYTIFITGKHSKRRT